MRYLLYIMLLGQIATAQTGKLKGLVLNNEGKPAEFVTIKLKEISKGTTTNEKGEFSISNIQPAAYTLIASFVGFKTLQKSISIEANKTTGISLELFENSELLKEIVVKGYINANEKVVSVGKIAIRPMDLPQSIAIIDRQMIENQQIRTVADVLANTNGVYIMGTTGGYQEEIAGRGFSFGSTNTFKNGVRFFNGMMSDLSNIEKVEVMKGSTAILYGNVAAGGIINLVTKKPRYDFGGEISLKTGSYGLLKPYFDIYGGIDKGNKLAYRFNSSFEQANSFRKGVSSERYYVNPSILYKIGKKTEILVEANYSKDHRTPDFGVGIINYKIVEIPREKYFGLALNKFTANQLTTNTTITHNLSENWKLSLTGATRNYETDLISNTRPNTGVGLIKTDGTWIRNVQKNKVTEDYSLAQLDITGKINIANTQHQILLGTDTDQFNTKTTAFNPITRYDTVNVFGTKTYKVRTDVPNMTENTLTTAPTNRFGVYLQDLISISSKIKLLAGIRYTYQQTISDVYTYLTKATVNTTNYDGAFSPRFGLVFQPRKYISLFGSFSNSFVLNSGVDIDGNALKPSLVDQYEAGFKTQLINNQLSLNTTIYKIINGNFAQTSLINGNNYTYIKELVGEVASTGIEIDINARPLNGLTIVAGYSYNETKYVKSNTYIEGSLLKYNPNHTANFSANYSMLTEKLKGLSFGIIGLYIGDRQAGRSTRIQVANDAYALVPLKGYTQLDGTVGYSYKKITIGAKIGNIFDVFNYNVHDDNSLNPITPRNYTLSMGLKF